MEKLLHERLRMAGFYDGVKLGGKFEQIATPVAKALADEIDRCYIPRPRFEDGEPIQFGNCEIEWEGESPFVFNAINADGIPLAIGGGRVFDKANMRGGFAMRRDTLEAIRSDIDLSEAQYADKYGESDEMKAERLLERLLKIIEAGEV